MIGAATDALLEESERLTLRGAWLDAIDLLTVSNRVEHDPRIEERLVDLRHEAFRTLVRSDEPPPPPLTTKPGVPSPLPETTPEELSVARLREGLEEHGCLLVRGLIDADEVGRLRDGIDRALEAFDAGAKGSPPAETTPWYRPFRPKKGEYRVGGRRSWMRESGGMWAADSPRMMYTLSEMIHNTGIGALVAAHFGERPALSANKCNLRRVPVTTSTNWHQDGAFLGERVRTVNLWLGLSDCGVDAPGLDVLPRRIDHIVETGTEGAMFDWSVSETVVNDLARDTPVVRPEFREGDALLFDQFFLHRTAVDDSMTRERYAIESWFFAPSAYPEGQIPLVY